MVNIPLIVGLSLVINTIFAIPLIHILYRLKFYKTRRIAKKVECKRNVRYYKFLEDTLDTPSSFGILLLLNFVSVLAVAFVFMEWNYSWRFVILVIFTCAFLLLGQVDDIIEFFFYLKTSRWGIDSRYKLVVELILSAYCIYLIFDPGILVVLLGSLFLTYVTNSFNITDGLDGLVGGPAIIIFLTYLYFEVMMYGDPLYMGLICVVVGFLLVFLYFNVNPARIFLGDVGALSLGFLVGMFALRYSLWSTIILLGILLFEGFSSLVQILSLKLFNKKVFLIAPFHLHLLNRGWTKNKVVFRFWVLQGMLSVFAVLVFNYHLS